MLLEGLPWTPVSLANASTVLHMPAGGWGEDNSPQGSQSQPWTVRSSPVLAGQHEAGPSYAKSSEGWMEPSATVQEESQAVSKEMHSVMFSTE